VIGVTGTLSWNPLILAEHPNQSTLDLRTVFFYNLESVQTQRQTVLSGYFAKNIQKMMENE
jgi:hypothetical protein